MNKKNYYVGGLLTGLFVGIYSGLMAHKKRNKIKAKIWMWKMKAKVYEQLRKLKNPKKDDFEKIVDSVMNKYKNMKTIGTIELENFSDDLKDKWSYIKKKLEEEDTDEEEDDDEEDEDEDE